MYVYVCVLEALMWLHLGFLTTRSDKWAKALCVCVCVCACVCVCVRAWTHMHCVPVSVCSMENSSFFSRCYVCVSYDSRCSQEGFMEQNDLLSSKLNDV